jgi:hypothetical protein
MPEPWIKVKIGLRRSDKVGSLPSDAARWGWVGVLLEAKVQRQMGVFASRTHLRDLMGRHGRFVPDWLRAGLLHEAPDLCKPCAERHPEAKAPEVIVHDYRREQRDPTNADRQHGFRNSPDEPPVTQTVTAPITPSVTAGVTESSRARATTVTVTATTTENVLGKATLGPSRNGKTPSRPEEEPRLTEQQLKAWTTFKSARWGPFKEAWLKRGYLFPPFGTDSDDDTSQRGLLNQIADARPNDLGTWIAEAPPGDHHSVITYALEQWHALREDVGIEEEELAREHAEELRDRRPLTHISEHFPKLKPKIVA